MLALGSRFRLALVILLSVATLSWSLTGASTAAFAQGSAAASDEALSIAATTRYSVDVETSTVSVDVEYLLTNVGDDLSISEFEEHLPANAEEVTASSRGVAVDVEVVSLVDDRDVWRIQLASDLRPGRTVEVSLNWIVRGGDPSDPATRVLINPAFISFPIYALGGDDNPGPVEVILPSQFQRIDSTGVSSMILAVDDNEFVSRVVGDLDPETVVRGWPDDGAWSTAMTAGVRSVIPQLEDWLGAARVASFEVREGPEVAFPDLEAGSMTNGRLIAIIDRDGDLRSLGRQVAAAWFDSTLPDVDWFRVAAVEVYGDRAAELADPESLSATNSPSSEASTAYFVVDALFNEIGPDAMADVITLMIDGGFTYPGPGDSGIGLLPGDWRTLLDAFEGIGGSSEATDLFRLAITDPKIEVDPLDPDGRAGLVSISRRAEALSDLADLEDHADGWDLPIWLRTPLAEWNFATFGSRRSGAEATLVSRDHLRESAVDAGLDLGDFVRDSFENATDSMAATNDLIVEQAEALEAVVEVTGVAESNSGLISRIGLAGTDVEAELDRIRSEFESGEFAEATDLSHSLAEKIEDSNAVGILRIVIPAVVTMAVIAAVGEIIRRRRSSALAGRRASAGEEVTEANS